MDSAQAKELFRYEAGKLFWRIKPATFIDPGDEAGCACRDRWSVGYKRKSYRRARLVWMLHHGDIPDGLVIDHINNIHDDDRIENLQALTMRQNTIKEKPPKDLPVGVRRRRDKFVAYARFNGKYTYLGQYATAEEAGTAYQQAIALR